MIRCLLAGAAVSAIALAAASSAAAAAAGADSSATSVQEVVVTAERRQESAKDVAISMSVISGKGLDEEHVTKINDLQNASPSLEIQPAFGGGAPQFRIRGVGFQDYGSNNAPTVGVYINEVAYPIPIMTQGAFFDIARVEVLRGPQGTLYGRNTTGGAVNIITNQPTSDFHAGAEVEFGSYNTLHAEAFVSGPIAQNLDSRLAFVTEQGGAFQFNRDTGQPLGNADRYGLRSITEWKPDGKLSLKLELHGLIDYSDGQGLYLFSPFDPLGKVLLPADRNHFATGWGLDSFFANDIGAKPGSAPFKHNTQDGAAIDVKYDLGFADLINITSYDFMNRRELEDWDASSFDDATTFFHTRSTVVSDELRLVSNTAGKLSWIAGAYVSYQNMNEAYLSDFLNVYGVSGAVYYNQQVTSEAVFGQAKYQFTDQWSLTGGLRFENEVRSLNNFHNEYLAGTYVIPQVPPTDQSQRMDPLTGKAVLEYKPESSLLTYASVSRGVKSGGFTVYNTGNVQSISPFLPESLWSYEGGFKWSLPYANLHLNGSAFHYDYHDEQVLSDLYTPGTDGKPATVIGHFVNAPRSHIDGGEIELAGEVLPHLSISQQLGYKVGKFDSFPNFVNVLTGMPDSQTGKPIPFPKFSYDGEVAYWVPVSAGYRLEVETNYSYHDYNPAPLPLPQPTYDIPSYWLFNANLTLTPPGGRWSAGIWCNNLFDRRYDIVKNFFIPGVNVAEPGAPREVGGRLTYAF
jgi:outer membrane receptor protein involved in Fe transport